MKTALTILALAGCAAVPLASRAQAPAGAAKHGQQVFMAVGCYQCHGTMGHGGQGPNLARLKLPAAAFEALVRQPVGAMPAYSANTVAAADLADVYAYLQSIPAPPEHRPAMLGD